MMMNRVMLTPGVRDMLLASALFAVMALLVKLVTATLPAGHPIFARSIIGLVVSYALIRHQGLSVFGKRPWLLTLRGAIGFTALLMNFHALSLMPLGEAAVIFQTHPIWTAILAAIFLGERLTWRVLVGSLVALGGVALISFHRAGPIAGDGEGASMLGPLLAFGAAILSAGAYVSVRALRRTDTPIVIVFWFALIATPASIPGLIAAPVIPAGTEWVILIAIGLTVQAAQMLMTRALHREAASKIAVTGYVQVIFAFALGVVFLGESINVWAIVGSVAIIGGALFVTITTTPKAAPKDNA